MNQQNKSTKSSLLTFAFSLFKTQLLIIILSLIVILSFSAILPTIWAQVLATVFGLYLYLALFYSHAWSFGERDRNLVLYDHIEADTYKGVKAGLLSNIPLFVMTILAIVQAYTTLIPESFRLFFNMFCSPFVLFTANLFEFDLTFLMPLLCVIAPIFSWFGYRHGYTLKEPFLKFVYSSPNKKKYRSRNGRKTENDPTAYKPVTAATVQRPGSSANATQSASAVKKAPKPRDGEKKLRSR